MPKSAKKMALIFIKKLPILFRKVGASASSEKVKMDFFQEIIKECECNICFETKADFVVPNCGHSICKVCCENIVRVENDDERKKSKTYKCPVCQSKHPTRASGYGQNRSLNAISEAFAQIKNRCDKHKCFSKTLKCLSCHEFELCALCFEENHTGHLVVMQSEDDDESMAIFRKTYISSENRPNQMVISTEQKIESTVITSLKKDEHNDTRGPEVRRGDCVLYRYNSCGDGQWYMGLGLVRRVLKPLIRPLDSPNDTTTSDNGEEELHQLTPLSSSLSDPSPTIKRRKRPRLAEVSRMQSQEVTLRISRVEPLSSEVTTTNDSLPLRPVIETMIDIPLFSIVSNHIYVNPKGGCCDLIHLM